MQLEFFGTASTDLLLLLLLPLLLLLIRRADNATALWVLHSVVYFHFCIPHPVSGSVCVSLHSEMVLIFQSIVYCNPLACYTLSLSILYTYAIQAFLSVKNCASREKRKAKGQLAKVSRLIFVLPSTPYHTIYSIYCIGRVVLLYTHSPLLIRFITFCC